MTWSEEATSVGKMSRKRRGRHEGTLRKRADDRYESRLDIGLDANGKRIRASFYGKTKQEALAQLNAARGLPTPRTIGRATVAEYFNAWLEDVRQRSAFSTYKQRETIARLHICRYIGGLRLSALRPEKIAAVLKLLRRSGIGQRTIELAYIILHVALADAVRSGLLATNPCDACAKPKVARRRPSIWNASQANAFLKSASGTPYYALFVLAITTGMRQGELLGLQWENVDLENRFLSVVYTLAEGPAGPELKEPKTLSSRRRVDLPNIAVNALRGLPGTERGFVFNAADGKPIRKTNFIRRVYHPLITKAGVPRIRFHDLRHTANTLLLLDGVSPNVLAERMGHTTTRMTLDTYGHVLAGAQRIAADSVDRIFAPSADFGGQMVVNKPELNTDPLRYKNRKFNVIKALRLVEMRGLEPRTPYMRSKCSTS
jgi:integrase